MFCLAKDKDSGNMLKQFILLLITAASASLFFGCSSVPKPKGTGTGMLILVETAPNIESAVEGMHGKQTAPFTITGEETFPVTVGNTKGKIHYFKAEPGDYRYEDPVTGTSKTISLPRDTILLIDESVSIDPNSLLPRLQDITPEIQKMVREDMKNYVTFYDWYGKRFSGFGPYVPRFTVDENRYAWEISTDPGNAEVTIDDQNWGNSPISVQLEPGKHLLRIEKEGFAAVQTYIDVQNEGQFSITMEKAEKESETAKQEKSAEESYAMMVLPFTNLGPADQDHLSTVLSDGITAGVFNRQNIRIIESEGDIGNIGDSIIDKHLAKAEKAGAELLISGHYYTKERSLFVSASLYDVPAEQVKTNTIYTGEAGLAMFDSIDEMTEQFINNLSKVLPETGKETIRREQVISSEMVSIQNKISEKEIALKRRNRAHSLSILAGFGEIVNTTDVWWSAAVLGQLFTHIHYEWEFFPQFLLNVHAGYPVFIVGDGKLRGAPIRIGPGFSFPGKMIDISLSPLGHFRYYPQFSAPPAPYDYANPQPEESFGPLILAGLSVDTSMKFYLTGNLSTLQHFIKVSIIFDVVQRIFDTQSSKTTDPPLGGNIGIGYGMRL